jgi:hypothetical protein
MAGISAQSLLVNLRVSISAKEMPYHRGRQQCSISGKLRQRYSWLHYRRFFTGRLDGLAVDHCRGRALFPARPLAVQHHLDVEIV